MPEIEPGLARSVPLYCISVVWLWKYFCHDSSDSSFLLGKSRTHTVFHLILPFPALCCSCDDEGFLAHGCGAAGGGTLELWCLHTAGCGMPQTTYAAVVLRGPECRVSTPSVSVYARYQGLNSQLRTFSTEPFQSSPPFFGGALGGTQGWPMPGMCLLLSHSFSPQLYFLH